MAKTRPPHGGKPPHSGKVPNPRTLTPKKRGPKEETLIIPDIEAALNALLKKPKRQS